MIKLINKSMEDFSKEQFEKMIIDYHKQQQEIDRLNNIIKEVRKYIEKHKETRAIYDPYGTPSGIPNRYEYYVEGYYELLEILDKENRI